MLCIPTQVRPSKIHGLGVFLLKPVKKGAVIWRFDSRIDRVYNLAEIESLPQHMENFLLIYGYLHEDTHTHVMYGDDARYINHSVKPNLKSAASAYGDLTAVQNLAAGTEITVDYRKHCDFVRITGKFW